jgi:hypothetical protein
VKKSRILPALSLVALFLGACSDASKTAQMNKPAAKSDAKLFAVSVESAAFFRHGPQAGRDPDKTLPRETVVKLIRPSFGFSKVQIAATGEQGYVASEEISPASSKLIASLSAPKPNRFAEPSPTLPVEQFNLNSDDPRLVPPPEALPPMELPAAPPEQ